MERDERYSKTQLAVNTSDYAHLIFWDLYHTLFCRTRKKRIECYLNIMIIQSCLFTLVGIY